jgi:hypothetical protein
MFDFDPTNLVIDLIFGAIGFVAFYYGRKMELMAPVLIGIALMFYPMFVRVSGGRRAGPVVLRSRISALPGTSRPSRRPTTA